MESEGCQPVALAPPAEASPFWGLVLVLAEIAKRVEREQAATQEGNDHRHDDAA